MFELPSHMLNVLAVVTFTRRENFQEPKTFIKDFISFVCHVFTLFEINMDKFHLAW